MVPAAADFDPAADLFVFHDLSAGRQYNEIIRNMRGMKVFSALMANSRTANPTTSTSLLFRRYFWPYNFKLSHATMTVEFVQTTGVLPPAIDVLNSGMSIFTGFTTASTGTQVVNCANGDYWGSFAIFTSMENIKQFDRLDMFLTSGTTTAFRAPRVHLWGWPT